MEVIRIEKKNNALELHLPTKNKGKFRWKTREHNNDYGFGFATTDTPFTDKAYIEWQIGYDAELNNEKKTTILQDTKKFLFVGANGKYKLPYELSEILYLLKELLIVTNADIENLITEIKSKNVSLDEKYKIKPTSPEKVNIAGYEFYKYEISLPAFSSFQKDETSCIEISIQKQQYASGVQPMVYLSIPLKAMTNYNDLINKTSKQVSSAIFTITKENSYVILNLFRFFGICSQRHKDDVISILNLLKN